jgi:hypothetical protein
MTMDLQVTVDIETLDELAELASVHGMPMDRIASGFIVEGIERCQTSQDALESMRACDDLADSRGAVWGRA